VPTYPKLPGYYSLKTVSCYCDPPRTSPLPHQEQCRLDLENNKLIIKTFGEDVNPLFLEEGEYSIGVYKDAHWSGRFSRLLFCKELLILQVI